MAALITDPDLAQEFIARRQATGADSHDEVWEGVYVMSPLANDEHQGLVGDLCTVLTIAIRWAGLGTVRPGVNVSDRKNNWKDNFRCPDVVVFLNDTAAENCGAFWFGGPDFAIEIVSPGDQTMKKLEFYEKVRTRELLIVDRDPWGLGQYRLQSNRLVEVGRSTLDNKVELKSHIVPLVWKLTAVDHRPAIAIRHTDGQQSWTVSTSGK